jgi:polyphosphate kinase 2
MAKSGDDAGDYKAELRELQIELVKLQRHVIGAGERILVLVEGRDGAGKDGVIKRIVQHLSPRETRVVALGKPSDRERSGWYFQRWVAQLPVAGELVLFNRSWYNRAGVERVMGFCTDAECEEFLDSAPTFEQMLIQSGTRLFKYYLDISRSEQKKRLKSRAEDPLKQWKISPVDARALRLWREYGRARDAMLPRTHSSLAPWTIVSADRKRPARLGLIRDLLGRLDYEGKKDALLEVDRNVVYPWSPACAEQGKLAP